MDKASHVLVFAVGADELGEVCGVDNNVGLVHLKVTFAGCTSWDGVLVWDHSEGDSGVGVSVPDSERGEVLLFAMWDGHFEPSVLGLTRYGWKIVAFNNRGSNALRVWDKKRESCEIRDHSTGQNPVTSCQGFHLNARIGTLQDCSFALDSLEKDLSLSGG